MNVFFKELNRISRSWVLFNWMLLLNISTYASIDFTEANCKYLFYNDLREFSIGLDTVPQKDNSTLPKKLMTKENIPWRPLKDSLGLFPLSCGDVVLPISFRGITTLGYMISNESNGFHLRFDNPYRIRTTSYLRKSKLPKIRTRSMGLELGYYSHPSLHRNIYVLGNRQWKFQKRKHWQYTLSFGVGYSRTFLTSQTYKLKDNEFQRVPLAAYNYLAVQGGATIAYRFEKKSTVYIGYNLLNLAPYNWVIMPRKQFQMGISIPTEYLIGAKHRPK